MSDQSWNPPITTTRLSLTPVMTADADELIELLGDRRLYRFTGGTPPHLDELRTRFEGWAGRISPDRGERWLNWVIRGRRSGRALGTLQATVWIEGGGLIAEVAWVVGISAQGHGYAAEAAGALAAFLLSMSVDEVIAHIHPDHAASARVASSIGMQPTQEWTGGERRWRLSDHSTEER